MQERSEKRARTRRVKRAAPVLPPGGIGMARIEAVEGLVQSLVESQKQIVEALSDLRQTVDVVGERRMPVARPVESVLREVLGKEAGRKIGEAVSTSRTVDLLNRGARASEFQPKDIVRLRPESSLHKRLQTWYSKQGKEIPDQVVGMVLKFLSVTNSGVRKYRVQFEGIGKDGCLEHELEFIKAA